MKADRSQQLADVDSAESPTDRKKTKNYEKRVKHNVFLHFVEHLILISVNSFSLTHFFLSST
jgi:hypothetical protein